MDCAVICQIYIIIKYKYSLNVYITRVRAIFIDNIIYYIRYKNMFNYINQGYNQGNYLDIYFLSFSFGTFLFGFF